MSCDVWKGGEWLWDGLRFEDEICTVEVVVWASEIVSDCLALQALQGQLVKENGRNPLYGVLKT